jgi:serine/threonine protein kinase
LKEVPECLFCLKKLKRLDLQGNSISFVPRAIGNLWLLQKLFLGGNMITDIPTELGDLPALQRLDLRKNKLQMLPCAVWALAVSVLQVEGNPLKIDVPEEIRTKGKEAIEASLKDYCGGYLDWPFVKLLVVGEEGVGKTSLLKRLGKNQTHDGISTDGVQVSNVRVSGTTDLQFKAYDFGGQEVFYPTHMFFMSSRSIFVVVFNAAVQNASVRVEYWLSYILVATAGTFPPPVILLVGTHCKSGVFDRALIESWARKYKVKYLVFVDNVHNVGFDHLSEMLGRAAANFSGTHVPKFYKVAIEVLAERSTVPIWKWEKFVLAASYFCVPRDEWLTMTKFLHDTGLLIFLEQPAVKDSFVVLNPQWLADRMSDVISFKHNWQNGTIGRNVLEFVWKKQGVEHDTQERLLKTFVRLGIFFERPGSDGGEFIAPSMLPLNCGESAAVFVPECGRDYQMNTIPAGLFGRLQVRIVSEPAVVVHSIWRNGISICRKEEFGLVSLEESTIRIRTGHGVYLLPFLVEALETIVKSVFTRFESSVERTIPCSHCLRLGLRSPKMFAFKECAEALKSGILKKYCGSDVVPLSELAPDVMMEHVPLVCGLVLGRVIGQGGFGRVFLGSMADGSVVAVKELSAEACESVEEQFRDLQHEICMISQLRHENLVQFIGITTCPIRVVMELCPLPDLSKHLHNEVLLPAGKLTSGLMLKFGLDIAKGMDYLHSQVPSIIHRDLRSPNVFVTSLDPKSPINAKVGDFGLAVHVMSSVSENLSTWQWLAPEILNGQQYDEKVDVYSFAVVLWEIGTRKYPFSEHEQFLTIVTDWVEYDSNGVPTQRKGRKEIWKEQQIRSAIIKEKLRPTIPLTCEFGNMISKCWHELSSKRPSFAQCVHYFASLLKMEVETRKKPQSREADATLVSLVNTEFAATCLCQLDDAFFVGGKNVKTGFAEKPDKPILRKNSQGILSKSVSEGVLRIFGPRWNILVDNVKLSHKSAIVCMCAVGASKVWSADDDGQIVVWKLLKKKPPFSMIKQSTKWCAHKCAIRIICEGRDVVYTGDSQGVVKIWDKISKKLVTSHKVDSSISCACIWNNVLIFGSSDAVNVLDSGILRSWLVGGSVLSVCAFGNELWCSVGSKGIKVFDLSDFPPVEVSVLEENSIIQSLVHQVDMTRDIVLYSGSQDGKLCCWSANSRIKQWEVQCSSPVLAVYGGKEVLALTKDKRIVTVVI